MTATRKDARAPLATSTAVLTTVVVPAFNEEEGLPVVLANILAVIDEATEILVVDDGSTDATREIASRFPCRLVAHQQNRGKGEAMRTAIREAHGENLIFIDADDTYPAHKIPEMIRLLSFHDVVIGSRKGGHAHIPAFNRIGNAIFRNSIRYFYGFKPYDPLTGFFGAKKRHLEALHLTSQNFRIESEIAIKGASMGLDMGDLQIEYGPRLGTAKLRGLQDGYTIFETIVKMLPAYSPALFLILPGLVLALGGIAASALLGLPIAAILLATIVALAGVCLASGGLMLLAHGVTRGSLSFGAVPRLLLAPASATALAVTGIAIICGAVAWALTRGSELAASDAGIEEAILGLLAAAIGLMLTAAGLLLSAFRPRLATPVRRHGVAHAVIPTAARVEGDEGPL